MNQRGTGLEARRPTRLLQMSRPEIITGGKGKNQTGSRYNYKIKNGRI